MKSKKSINDITKKINSLTKNFLYSKWSLFLVFVFILTTSLIPFVYSLVIGSIGWEFYLLSFVAFISSLAGLYGDIFLHRNNKICFLFYFIFIFIYLINVISNRLWYETITQLIVLGIVFSAYINWGKTKEEKPINIMKLETFLLYLVLLIVISILLGLFMDLYINEVFKEKSDPYPYLDAIISVTFIGGWVLMIKKYMHAYIVYIICTIATIILSIIFIINGSYYYLIYLVTNLFYLGLYVIGSSNWMQIYFDGLKEK